MSSILLQYSKIKNFLKKNFEKLHTQKNGPSGAPGLACASPWRAKVSQYRKTERGDFGIFQHPFCRKTWKNWKQKFSFSEKNLTKPKKLKGGAFGIFQHPFCRKTSKKCRGTLWGNCFFEKSLAVPKKMKGGSLWSRPVWYVTRKNRKNLFGSVR